jgi:radial spoke head protein 4A
MTSPTEEDGGTAKFPNLPEEFGLLEWAGFGLGKAEVYRLYLSIKKLAEKTSELEVIRFFGRFTTLGAPYYVVECPNNTEEDEAPPLDIQEGVDGANKYMYLVSQTLAVDSWIQLPNVTCKQVMTSSSIKRFLSGRLEEEVACFPPFPGKGNIFGNEKNLLRAQIARISGATLISPSGYFNLSDEGTVERAEVEELKTRFPTSAFSLCKSESWKHHERELNSLGRATEYPAPEDAEEDAPPSEESKVPVSPPLSDINATAWSLRVCPGCAAATSTSMVIAKSLKWPGAVAIASPRSFICAYFGNGLMFSEKRFCPLLPSMIQQEGLLADFTEESDPAVDPTPPPEPEPIEDEEQNEDNEEES